MGNLKPRERVKMPFRRRYTANRRRDNVRDHSMMDQNDLIEAAQLLEEFLDFYHFPDGVCRSRPVARMAARMPNPDIERMKKVCIIGGGPAGIMVAGALQYVCWTSDQRPKRIESGGSYLSFQRADVFIS